VERDDEPRRLLGALVGGFIVLINARTIFGVTAETPALRG
jgi:hypothetical protein